MTMADPTVKPIDVVLERLQGVKPSGKGWKARCPAHDDRHPSLSVGIGEDNQVLLKCHTGCDLDAIVDALGLQLRDLWPEDALQRFPQIIRQVGEYRYPIKDELGRLIAYHVRRERSDGSKTFAWLQPDEKTWNLNGHSTLDMPLYGTHDLPDTANVIVTEGEKAADALRSIDIRAVATITGATSTPSPDVLEPLLRYQSIYLWPDNDREGVEHMRRIAHRLQEMGHSDVRRLGWRDAGPKDDAADFVTQGYIKKDVLEIARHAQVWDTDIPPEDEQEPEPEAPPRYQIFHAQEIKEREPPPQLIRGVMLDQSHSVLFGNPGTYKSFIALEMASRIANGGLWFGHPVEQGPVLYTTGEGQASFGTRIRAWELDRGEENNVWILPEAVQYPNVNAVEDLLRAIDTQIQESPRLIIIDTLARSTLNLDENSAEDMNVFIQGVDRVIREYGCSVLTIHHANRQGFYRGSSALLGAWDTVMESKKDDNDLVSISCVKQKDLNDFRPITVRPETVTVEPGKGLIPALTSIVMYEESTGILTSSAKTVFEVLNNEFPDGTMNQPWEEAAASAGIKRRSFFNAKKQLMNLGLITASAGVYRPSGYTPEEVAE